MRETDFNTMLTGIVKRMMEQKVITARIADSRLGPELKIQDLGLDSIGKMNLLMAIENELEMSVPFESLKGVETLNEFSVVLSRLVADRGNDV